MTTLTTMELVLGLLAAAPPSVSEVVPDPLPLASAGEVRGTDFAVGATSFTIGGVAQQVTNVQPETVRFLVALDTPLGSQTGRVTTPEGYVEVGVVVAPRAPRVDAIAPDALVLGGLATIQGEGLATVTEITLDGEPVTITEQTEVVIVFEVPFEADLLGNDKVLVVRSPSGSAQRTVTVVPPRPDVDAIAPNPARQGDLVTIRGAIAPLGVGAKIGLVDAPVVAVAPMEVTVLVTEDVSVGPHDVTVSVAQQTSAPEGPLFVQAASALRPRVIAAYPANVALGGELVVIGEDLDSVVRATGGLSVVACERRACRLTTSATAAAGAFTAAVDGPEGADVFSLQLVDEAVAAPTITSVSPSPAFRGETLTIEGSGFQGLRNVVIGGTIQPITFFDGTSATVTVAETTSLGAEALFVTGNTASAAFTVTVLDPFPSDDVGGDTGGADASADTAGGDADAGGADTGAPGDGGGKDGGCVAGGGHGGGAGLMLLFGLLAWLLVRRTRSSVLLD